MPNHHFISYSRIEAKDFALRLCDDLKAGPPALRAWIDVREIKPGRDWDEEISEAIKTCETLLFVMTPDSVRANSQCKNEWASALKYKKAVIPLLWQPEAETPFRLSSRQYIDFTDDYESALARLRQHLQWLSSPPGMLATLRDRLADAERDLPRAESDAARARVEADLQELRRQVTEQQWIVEHPEEADRRVEKSIATALERERQPAQPVSGSTRTKFINPPPGLTPSYFQDRHAETGLIGEFVKNEALRLLTIVGRGGIGKTAVVCRLLKALERGQLPEDGGPLSVDGIVYLSNNGSRRVNLPNFFADICELLPNEPAEKLKTLFRDPQLSTEAKVKALLAAFPQGRVIVLLDNFEDVVNPETHGIADGELAEALPALLKAPHHGLKVILTTRIAPRDLALIEPGRQMRLNLDEGLPSPLRRTSCGRWIPTGKWASSLRPTRCSTPPASARAATRAPWRHSLPFSRPTATPRWKSCWPTPPACCPTTWSETSSAKPLADSIPRRSGLCRRWPSTGGPSPRRRWITSCSLSSPG